jgi:Holliday junction resolvase-like predicted endonuclease
MAKVVWARLDPGKELIIRKSTRHQHIIGKYGEYLVCNLLSRTGFEVAIVDHTGIDIIAYNPKTKQRLGITVKSRTRDVGQEKDAVQLFKSQNDLNKLKNACKAFGCIPCIAVYVETANGGDLFLTSLDHYRNKYARPDADRKIDSWKMAPRHMKSYMNDREISHIRYNFELNPVE